MSVGDFPPVPPEFYKGVTISVARRLLGKLLVHGGPTGVSAGKIVETEAYLSMNDPACHASRGRTKRNAVMFEEAGHGYIYFIYGMHYCFNVVTGPVGVGEAVLVRAIEPVAGAELMSERRGCLTGVSLTNGPAKLVQALGIPAEYNGLSLAGPPLWISDAPRLASKVPKGQVVQTTRIGINVARELPYRFYIKDNPYVSRR